MYRCSEKCSAIRRYELVRIWKYANYKEYVSSQVKRWKSQRKKVKPFEYYKNIVRPLFDFVDKDKISTVICQGVRNDNEVQCMRKIFKKSTVYGTDISYESHAQNIYRLDFSKCPEDWGKKFDLLFSNSIDHSYIGEDILKEWVRITRGYMIIQFAGSSPRPSDPFSVDSDEEIRAMCGKYGLEILRLKNLYLLAKVTV